MDEKQQILIVDAEIVEATSGNQALKTTLLYDFSLAILDVQMPEMDGYELAELLRGDPKTANLPIIFMTAAYGEEIDIFKGYEAGAVDYIVKPYNPAVLLAKVHIFLDLQRAQKELARRVLELSASEERYRTLVTTIPDIVYRIDNEGRFTFLNDAVRSIGYSPEELIGLPFAEIVIPSDVENVSRRFVLPRFAGKRTGDEGAPKLFDERRTGSRQTLTMEVRLVSRRAGRAVPAELHSSGLPVLTAEVNSSGLYGSIEGRPPTFLGTVGIIRDISQRKEAEDELSRYRQGLEKMVEEQTVELKEAEGRYRAIFEGAAEGILVEDRETRKFMYANAALCEMLGYASEELKRMSVSDIYPKEASDYVISEFEAQAKGEKKLSLNIPCLRKDGTQIEVDIRTSPIRVDGKECNVGFFTDITERRQIEEQFRQAQKMEAIGTLAGGIAHDFNNILSSVLGYTELALDDAEEGTQLRTNLLTVLSAGERARDLVQQILAFSRQSEKTFSPIQVKLITKEALNLLRAILPTTVEIRQDIQSDSMVLGDLTQIHQVLLNLCTNADHAMREKGGLLEVTLVDVALDSLFTAKHPEIKPGAHLRLMVRDTGRGIPPLILDRIFDPFFTTKDKSEGTGMGLSVVHGIVKAHGGAITVQSEPGKGAIFNVFLPVIEKTIAKEAPIEKPISTGTERILFVDDELQLARLGKQELEFLGYDVTTRTSSIEALELFKAQPDRFDLVITDMTMPNLTGDELALKLAKIRPDIPIILCTGFSHKITKEKSKEMGIKVFLFKPILRKVMAETVRRVLDEKD